VELEDLRGILHAHTDQSDGGNSLEQMAEATRKRGYEYFGVAGHSQSARYSGGLSVEQIRQQHAEIDRFNARFDGFFRIFKGIESDILADGSLDYPDEILRKFDFIVASIHGQFRMDRELQTERLLRAVANPFVTVLGHMTGRLLSRRSGYEVDVEKVLKACADHGVAVEINANPWRLDLDWRWHRLELGYMFSLRDGMGVGIDVDLMRWGLAMAHKGGHKRGSRVECVGPTRLFPMARGPQKSHRSAEREDRSKRPSCPRSALADLLQSGQRVKTVTGIERDPRDRPARLAFSRASLLVPSWCKRLDMRLGLFR